MSGEACGRQVPVAVRELLMPVLAYSIQAALCWPTDCFRL